MRFNIENYNLNSRLFSAAFNSEILSELREKGLNCALLRENTITFYPEKIEYIINEDSVDKLNCCENYDVLFVNENGNGWVQFFNAKEDNSLVLTQRCNSNCVMCPVPEGIRKNGTSLSIEDIIESVKYIPNDARHLTITGGEPFLAGERIFDLFSEIKRSLPYTECLLLTNGRALGYAPYAEKFAETAPKDIIIGIPLHGYNEETHDYITRSKGGFEQTVAGIKNLIYYGFNVEIRIVVSRLNYKEIDKISEFIINEFPKVGSVKIMGLEMLGNAAKNIDDVWITYKTAFKYSKSGIVKLINNCVNVSLYNFPLCAVDKSFHLLCKKSITDYKIRFPDKCEGCTKMRDCGGIFAGTMRLAKDDVVPYD